MSAKSIKSDRRIQFDVLPERLEELDRLMEFCDMRTRKELFDNAITLFEWAVGEVKNGYEVASYNRDEDHVEVVRFPVLDLASRRAKRLAQIELVNTEGSMEAAEEPSKPLETIRNRLGLAR